MVHAAASILSRLPLCPAKLASPPTVIVRPFRLEKDEEVPPVMVKSSVVVMFRELKSRTPALWV
jgi:hypothetical protein